MGKGPDVPSAKETAEAQRSENTWTSQYNTIGSNANQYTPYGTVTNAPGAQIPIYDEKGNITGYGTQWNQTTTLSPAQQAIFDQENAAKLGFGTLANQQLNMAKDVLGKPITTEGMTPWAKYGNAPQLQQANYQGTDRQAIEDAIMRTYERSVGRAHRAEDTQLAARGAGAPGSQKFAGVQQGREDARGAASDRAYLASGEESRAQAGESRNVAEFVNKVLQSGWLNENTVADQANALRQSQWGERTGLRNQILNELSVLAGNAPATVPQGQAYQGSQVNPFDWNSAIQNQYAAESANYQNQLSGLFGIGKSLMSLIPGSSLFGGLFSGSKGLA